VDSKSLALDFLVIRERGIIWIISVLFGVFVERDGDLSLSIAETCRGPSMPAYPPDDDRER